MAKAENNKDHNMRKIKIFAGNMEIEAELNESKTAKAIYDALPFEGSANRWGDEIYFVIPVTLDAEKDAKDVVEYGDVAYWPEGSCFCIFFGKTPESKDNEIRAASKVNVFAKIKDPNSFKHVKNGYLIIIEKAL